MKKTIALALIACVLLAGTAAADIGSDKYMHTGACAAISSITDFTLAQLYPDLPQLYRVVVSVTASMLVGLGKELADEKVNGEDLAADFAGSLIGVSFTIQW